MPPKISLIYATARLGGLDMLFNSLLEQNMPREDFELIIVDDWFDKRSTIVAVLNSFPNFRHVLPKNTGISYHNSASFNSGLALAQGEIIIHLVDFIWLPANFLDDHWRFYKEHPGYSLSVYVDRYKYPSLRYPPVDDIGIFEQWFDVDFAERWFKPQNLIYQERKGGTLGPQIAPEIFEIPGDRIYMLGDSIPLAMMKELNGWDQCYCGGYGVNDIDLATRANMIGWKFAVDMSAPILIKLGDKSTAHLLPTIKTEFLRTPEDNYKIFQERIKAIQEGRESVRVPDGRGSWE